MKRSKSGLTIIAFFVITACQTNGYKNDVKKVVEADSLKKSFQRFSAIRVSGTSQFQQMPKPIRELLNG